MAEEIKVTKQDGQTGAPGQENESPTRSEQRHKDLADKLAEQDRTHSLELEELKSAKDKAETESKNARFEADLLRESSKYPHASEYTQDIRSYVDKGLSVSEATTLVLGKNNKLVTGTDQARSRADASSFGGSSVTSSGTGQQEPEKMTQEERRAELQRMEDKGDFGVKDGGFFIR